MHSICFFQNQNQKAEPSSARKQSPKKILSTNEELSPLQTKSPQNKKNKLKSSFQQEQKHNLEQDRVWNECQCAKIQIPNRAYHSSVFFNQEFYVFGGRDIEKKAYNDMYKFVKLENSYQHYWIQIKYQSDISPQSISEHTAILYQSKMYVFGGRVSPIKNSQFFYAFDFESFQWNIIDSPNTPVFVNGHSASILNDKMVVFGGYNCESSTTMNMIQIYDFSTNDWTIHKAKDKNSYPEPRLHHASVVYQNLLFVFGGQGQSVKLNDLWSWNEEQGWLKVISKTKVPSARLGHKLMQFDDRILLFGGCGGLLKEKNDIWIFDITKTEWVQFDRGFDFERQRRSIIFGRQQSFISKKHVQSMQFNYVKDTEGDIESDSQQSKIKYRIKSPKKVKTTYKQQKIEEIRLLEKKNLQKDFKLEDDEERKLIVTTPTTNHLRKSIEIIEKVEKNRGIYPEEILSNNDLQIGMRPLPRDGFSFCETQNGWIIFGGDRHRVSYNDTWILNREAILDLL